MWIIKITNEPTMYFKYYGLENDIDAHDITTTASKKNAGKIYDWKEATEIAEDMNGKVIRYNEELSYK